MTLLIHTHYSFRSQHSRCHRFRVEFVSKPKSFRLIGVTDRRLMINLYLSINIDKIKLRLWENFVKQNKIECCNRKWSTKYQKCSLLAKRLHFYIWRTSIISKWLLNVQFCIEIIMFILFLGCKFIKFAIQFDFLNFETLIKC